jgi:hypothetical protein
VVLPAAQGQRNDEIARRLNSRREVISMWRKRFFEERLPGLEERPRSGRPDVGKSYASALPELKLSRWWSQGDSNPRPWHAMQVLSRFGDRLVLPERQRIT